MSVPSMMIEPLSGLSSPMSVLRKTDLPVPEGPSMTQISPAGTVSVTSPQMSCLPKDLLRSLTWISTPMFTLPAVWLATEPGDSRPACYGVSNAGGRGRLRPEETIVTRVSGAAGAAQLRRRTGDARRRPTGRWRWPDRARCAAGASQPPTNRPGVGMSDPADRADRYVALAHVSGPGVRRPVVVERVGRGGQLGGPVVEHDVVLEACAGGRADLALRADS